LTGDAPLPTLTSTYFSPEAVVTALAAAVFPLALAYSCAAMTGMVHIADNTATTTALLLILILWPPSIDIICVQHLTLS